jgi:hypothetical protein
MPFTLELILWMSAPSALGLACAVGLIGVARSSALALVLTALGPAGLALSVAFC